jgi:hypothetical protein
MIPFGPWRPDAATLNAPLVTIAQNVLPSPQGFRPLPGPVVVENSAGLTVTDDALEAITDDTGETVTTDPTSLDGRCRGAVTVILEDGSSASFAGTVANLYQLQSASNWLNATRTSGGSYSTASGERWRFEVFGDNLIATNFIDDVQKFDITGGTNFAALGGSPPKARYIAVVREFVVLGCIYGDERKVHWSAIGNSEGWTAGTNSSDVQTFPSGGPVRGLIGGEVGYVFQDDRVSRMIFAPGTPEVFQFDEVEGGRGLKAANSLVRLAREAFYFGGDGFYRFDLGSGASAPIGVGKWANWFLGDLRAGTEGEILGAVSPRDRVIVWAYISRQNGTTTPDRVVFYDWSLDEATFANIDVEAIAQWLSQGYTLDTMNAFGSLDTLPYSLDAPFWKAGTSLLALFSVDHKLSYLQGSNMAAEFITAEGQGDQRMLITATRPHIDSAATTVAVVGRERDGDGYTFGADEVMEDTGEVPAWVSGNIFAARIRVPTDETWTYAKGISATMKRAGKR